MSFLKGKSKRTIIFGVITLSSLIILIVLNFLLSFFSQRSVIYFDLSPEGLYSLTDRMVDECNFIDDLGKDDGEKKVKITFCTDRDYLTSSYVLRPTYYMSLCLEKQYDNLEVEAINVSNEPTALSAYKKTSLTEIKETDVIISYGERYRILSAENFWAFDSSNKEYFAYNGEYKMATLIKSVTAINQPAAYFVTDHGETYYDVENPDSEMSVSMAYCYDMLRDCGLQVKTLKISEVSEIPSDCALLIINNPRTDFATNPDRYDELNYVSDLDKLDRYLVNHQGAIMVAKDYDEAVSLPVFEDFLHEWGFDFSSSIVRDEKASVSGTNNTGIITVYDTEENSYANAIYGEFANIATSPDTIAYNTGYITSSFGDEGSKNEPASQFTSKVYAPFLQSPATSSAYMFNPAAENGYLDSSILDTDGEFYKGEAGCFDLAAVTVREAFNSTSAEYVHSYLFCSASPDFFSNQSLGNPSYANYEVVSALINNISRTDVYASIDLGGATWNSISPGGKQLVSSEMSEENVEVTTPNGSDIVKINYGLGAAERVLYTVLVALVPVAVAVVGIVICVRRRFL